MAEPTTNTPYTATFSADKYSIGNHSYPADLMSPQYGGNYVIFYINVAIDSKLLTPSGGGYQVLTDQPQRNDRGEFIKSDLSKGAAVAGAVTGTALQGGAAGGLWAGDVKGAVKGAAIAAAPGAVGLGAAATQAASMNRAQKQLKTAIALHVPNQLQIRYGTQWSEEDTTTAVMAPLMSGAAMKALAGAAGGAAIGGLVGGKKGAAIGAVGGGLAMGAMNSPEAAALGLAYGPNAGAISAGTGLAFNPRKEQVFKGVDFRTFSFDYQFFPRDAGESRNVLNIIKEFKLHMHPEYKDTNKFMWIYPSEFDIAYYSNGKENKAIHRHTSCVLTEMSVNYTPNGSFTTFEDGTPTQINVQMTFRELALMDKDRIQAGM